MVAEEWRFWPGEENVPALMCWRILLQASSPLVSPLSLHSEQECVALEEDGPGSNR